MIILRHTLIYLLRHFWHPWILFFVFVSAITALFMIHESLSSSLVSYVRTIHPLLFILLQTYFQFSVNPIHGFILQCYFQMSINSVHQNGSFTGTGGLRASFVVLNLSINFLFLPLSLLLLLPRLLLSFLIPGSLISRLSSTRIHIWFYLIWPSGLQASGLSIHLFCFTESLPSFLIVPFSLLTNLFTNLLTFGFLKVSVLLFVYSFLLLRSFPSTSILTSWLRHLLLLQWPLASTMTRYSVRRSNVSGGYQRQRFLNRYVIGYLGTACSRKETMRQMKSLILWQEWVLFSLHCKQRLN